MHALNDFFAMLDGYIGGSSWFVYLLIGTGAGPVLGLVRRFPSGSALQRRVFI